MARFGYWMLLLYVIATFTRFFELVMPQGRIPRLMLLCALGIAVLTGRIFAPLIPKIGRYWCAFMFWAFLGAPFSVWPVGALQKTVFALGRSFALFLGLVSYVDTWKRVRWVTAIMAACFSWISLYLLFNAETMNSGSRITSDLTSTDPNEMALQMLFALPLWLFFLADRSASKLLRLVSAPAALIAVGVMARSGSRAMVLTAGVLALFLMFRLSWQRKIQAGALMAVGLVVFLFAAPQESIVRYKTLMGNALGNQGPRPQADPSGGNMEGIADSATQSTNHRLYILERSIEVTLRNPIFGVGTAMFPVAEGIISREESGRKGAWKGTHNTYTEISSQQGIPALILFLFLLAACWRKLTALERMPLDFPEAKAMRRYAFMMKVCFVNVMTFAGTLGITENAYFFVLSALVLCLENAVATERRRHQALLKAREAKEGVAAPAGRRPAVAPPQPQPVGVA